MWLSSIVVLLCGIIIQLFEEILKSNRLMNDYYVSCSSGRVALIVLKQMVQEMIIFSRHFNTFKFTCHCCDNILLVDTIKPLMNMCFNIKAKIFTLLLNR